MSEQPNEPFYWEQQSRCVWRSLQKPLDETQLHTKLQLGCLQRIARALETLAENSDPVLSYQKIENHKGGVERSKSAAVRAQRAQPLYLSQSHVMDFLMRGFKPKPHQRVGELLLYRVIRGLVQAHYPDEDGYQEIRNGSRVVSAAEIRDMEGRAAAVVPVLPAVISRGPKTQALYVEWLSKATFNGQPVLVAAIEQPQTPNPKGEQP